MTKTTRTLLNTITSRAEATFDVSRLEDSNVFPEWERHYIATAEKWRDELDAEGLTQTVEKMNELINFHKKMCCNENKEFYHG